MLYNQKSLNNFAIFESFSNQEKCENKNGFIICKDGDHEYIKTDSKNSLYCDNNKPCINGKVCVKGKYDCEDGTNDKRSHGLVNMCVECTEKKDCKGDNAGKECIGYKCSEKHDHPNLCTRNSQCKSGNCNFNHKNKIDRFCTGICTKTCTSINGLKISNCKDGKHTYIKHNTDSKMYCDLNKSCPANKHCLIDKYDCHADSGNANEKRYPAFINHCVDCTDDIHCQGEKKCIGNTCRKKLKNYVLWGCNNHNHCESGYCNFNHNRKTDRFCSGICSEPTTAPVTTAPATIAPVTTAPAETQVSKKRSSNKKTGKKKKRRKKKLVDKKEKSGNIFTNCLWIWIFIFIMVVAIIIVFVTKSPY